MEVNQFGVAIVNLAFGMREEFERLKGERLCDRANGGVGDDLPNLFKAAMNVGFVRLMSVSVLVGVSLVLMRVSVFMPMGVSLMLVRVSLMLVRVSVFMFVRSGSVKVERLVSAAVDEDINLGCGDSTAFNTMGYQFGIHAETAGNGLQCLQRNACIYGRAKKHVAADSRETVEVGNTHWDPDGRLPEIQV